MSTLTLENLSKTYPNGARAVDSVSLRIPDGCFCALLGPSGCGKSTLLRMIAGIEAVSSGEVLLGDTRITNWHPKDRDMAMVFQNYALYPHLTVEENIAFPLTMRKVPRAERDARVAKAADQLQLNELLARRPSQLSGGQRQRVAVARAIVRQPSVFLFDEPLSNLDAKLRLSTRAELKHLHQRLRITSIYVTHDQEEAMALGDLVVVMSGGRVQQIAHPLDLFEAPANRFVAGFIGSPPMNFFDAQIGSDGVITNAPGFALRAIDLPRGPARAAILGVRPTSIRLAEPGEAGAVSARVESVEPLGETMDLILTVRAVRVLARVVARRGLGAADTVGIRIDAAKSHLFEPADAGARIPCGVGPAGTYSECTA